MEIKVRLLIAFLILEFFLRRWLSAETCVTLSGGDLQQTLMCRQR